MEIDPDGAQLFQAVFAPAQIDALEIALAAVPSGRPGTRLRPVPGLAEAVQPATLIAASILGRAASPVRAMLFDKSPRRNWSVGWHQDRTIAVRARIDTPGFAA